MIHVFLNYWITKSNIGVSALKKMFDSDQSKLKGNLEKSKSITNLYKNDKSCNYESNGLSTHKTGNVLIHEKFILHIYDILTQLKEMFDYNDYDVSS